MSHVPSAMPMQGLGITPTTSHVPSAMPMQGPGIAPTTSHVLSAMPMQGPGIAPTMSHIPLAMPMQGPVVTSTTSHVPPAMPMQGPGITPTMSHVPSAMPMQGPVVTSTTSHVPPAMPTMAQGPSIPSMAGPLPKDLNMLTTNVCSARIKELQKRRYQYKQKMSPRVEISAAYVPHSLHIFADVLLRDICSADWCASHPEGTVGEFNLYWDNMDEDLRKVRLTQSSCTS